MASLALQRYNYCTWKCPICEFSNFEDQTTCNSCQTEQVITLPISTHKNLYKQMADYRDKLIKAQGLIIELQKKSEHEKKILKN